MADEKKFVEEITSMEEDFAQWYTDVVKKAELTGYTQLKGFMVIKPAGYAIWENIQHELDRRFKETGVENVYLPCLIPEGLLQKEKDHVEGFAPEVAWVTHGGAQELEERMCVRPTSGARSCAGRRRPARSCVRGSFCGRKDTRCTRRPGRPRSARS